MVVTLAASGLRFGEVSALQWDDLHEAELLIQVKRSQVRGRLGLPKNGKSRTSVVPPFVFDVLRWHRQRDGAQPGGWRAYRSDLSQRHGGLPIPIGVGQALQADRGSDGASASRLAHTISATPSTTCCAKAAWTAWWCGRWSAIAPKR
jgi:integrase